MARLYTVVQPVEVSNQHEHIIVGRRLIGESIDYFSIGHRVCKRCIRRMDHHCVFINNCVGENNQKYFILFTVRLTLSSSERSDKEAYKKNILKRHAFLNKDT